jgi:hypothetical protein
MRETGTDQVARVARLPMARQIERDASVFSNELVPGLAGKNLPA